MAGYNLEHITHDLNELGIILRCWHNSKDSDSVLTQDLRSAEFGVGAQMMKELVEGVQPAQRLQLKVGSTAIRAVRFHKGAYDMLTPSWRTLEADSELELKSAQFITIADPNPKQELYVGFVTQVALSEIAKTLTEGGRLELIGASARTVS